MPANWKCRQEIDEAICKLKSKKQRYYRAEGRRLAVRGHYELKPTAEKFNYVCLREEFPRRRPYGGGGQDLLIRHNGNFRRILHRLSQIYAEGGRAKSFHFTNDPTTTSCHHWAQRNKRR